MANKAISTLAVGSSVYLNVGGVRKEFLVVHQGLPSSLYDASCDGTWLLMKDCYTNRVWSDYSSNNYKIAAINTYLNGPFLGLFDSNIQGIIKQVKIPYVNGTGGAAVASGADGLSCKVFLLGGCEVGLSSIGNVPSDGVKLDYFDSTVSTDTKRVANLNGSPIGWALRSADSNTSNTIWFITVRGSSNNYQSYANGSFGIRPALILPSTTLVDDSGNVVTVDLTAHKTLINGTAYTVQGGKCMVGGTVYNILKGRTLIGGTGYDILFGSNKIKVTITAPKTGYASVTIDGVRYSSAAELEVEPGTAIKCEVKGSATNVKRYIYRNGELVSSGNAYSMTAEKDVSIELTYTTTISGSALVYHGQINITD